MRKVKEDLEMPLTADEAGSTAGDVKTLRAVKGDLILMYAAHHLDAATFAAPDAFVAGAPLSLACSAFPARHDAAFLLALA
jgi:hypothetical protein